MAAKTCCENAVFLTYFAAIAEVTKSIVKGIGIGFLSCIGIGIGIGIAKTISQVLVLVLLRQQPKYVSIVKKLFNYWS